MQKQKIPLQAFCRYELRGKLASKVGGVNTCFAERDLSASIKAGSSVLTRPPEKQKIENSATMPEFERRMQPNVDLAANRFLHVFEGRPPVIANVSVSAGVFPIWP